MADDSEVKAPVTRLRRRLSVEQSEQTNSPGPSTPTKKRGGRLTAKPQLELIDENTPGGTKRQGKKTAIKELSEVTEEKPVTPSRRSARIKSNTSIVSETTQNYDSPRAKRAARRTSHAGSDTETVVTPARQSKRTRKDSTSSVDKLETTLGAKPYITYTEVIIEETDSSNQNKENSINDNGNDNTSIRKSPRLRGKKVKEGDKGNSQNNTQEMINVTIKDTGNEVKKGTNNDQADHDISVSIPNSESTIVETEKNNTSNSSFSVIKNLDIKPKRKSLNLNKSTSALENNNEQVSFMHKRQRTTSLTCIAQTQFTQGTFYSDNESSKKKNTKIPISIELSVTDYASGDSHQDTIRDKLKSELNMSRKCKEHNSKEKEIALDKSLNNSKSVSRNDSFKNISENCAHGDTNSVLNIIEENTITTVQSSVFFEDSSNSVRHTDINRKSAVLDSGDQCVPVVETENNKNGNYADNGSPIKSSINEDIETKMNIQSEIISTNNSCEPMDIDETIPNSTTICETSVSGKKSLNIENSIDTSLQDNNRQKRDSKKPKSMSTNSLSTTQNFEATTNESKTTLILSHNKDMSLAENSVTNSPVTYKTSNEILSKSANLDVKHKGSDKKKLSLDYSTSTPLQQKRSLKLGMQINSSIIETTRNEPEKSKTEPDVPVKEANNISTNSDKTTSSENESDEEKSKSMSNLLDVEADVADDDYESGDSQDDEARKYEEENQIVERGETLDSKDEISNDTDYEKDSFVVSGSEELLTGSGDDLSMSDKELTMSKKSKKKYNERKLKEQKNASREMFESRHKLNNNEKAKKKTKKIYSSSESEDENIAPVKKNKRQRLDSTREDSLNESNANKSKPNRMKRLSESLCESPNVSKNKSLKKSQKNDSSIESEDECIIPVKKNKHYRLDSTQEESLNESNINKGISNKKKRLSSLCKSTIEEQEISTVVNKSNAQIDPLSVAVKSEPKTPIKDLNLSSVQIFDNIKEVNIGNDTSIIAKTDQTQDPLQATMAEESDSSISENSEIMKNYDSVLDELNNEKQRKIKEFDTSLNLNKKKEKKSAEAIVDELNLTRAKTPKNNKKCDSDVINSNSNLSKSCSKQPDQTSVDDEDSCDSNRLQFLFSEDSSEVDPKIKNNNSQIIKETADDFIPLKRTPGKINILNDDNKSPNTCDNDEVLFVIDTKGKRENEEEPSNVSVNTSARKIKKIKSLNISSHAAAIATGFADRDNDTPTEMSFNAANKSKIKKSTRLNEDTNINETLNTDSDVNVGSSKKKLSVSFVEDKNISNDGDDAPIETSFKKTKKNKNKESTAPEEDINETLNEDADNTTNEESSKKKKKHSLSLTKENDADATVNLGSSKKKLSGSFVDDKNISNDGDDAPTEISFKKTKRNKNKESTAPEEDINETLNEDAVNTINVGSSKKKKKHSLSRTEENDIVETTPKILNSGKKNKKSKSQNESITDDTSNLQKVSIDSAKKLKPETAIETSTSQIITKDTSLVKLSNSKKRKRMSSVSKEDNDASQSINTSITMGMEKKKRKLLEEDTNSVRDKETDHPNKKTKADDKKASEHISIQTPHESETVKTKKNQKRKRDDDNDVNQTTKVLKQNSFDKVQVTRLPASVLNLLDDKPTNEVLRNKKSKVVSTASFVVEESRKRKNKPSNFLEESVYLNDDNVEKGQKGHIKKPKVLPFVPTATTSDSGFTTNFKIDIINKKVEFVAKLKHETNFKNDYLYGKRIKRFGTYEMYKKHRNAKMSKF